MAGGIRPSRSCARTARGVWRARSGNGPRTAEEDPNPKTDPDAAEGASNLEKDPGDWVTGGEPMTAAQASYLKTLAEQAGGSFDPNLTKAEASARIDELRERIGRAG